MGGSLCWAVSYMIRQTDCSVGEAAYREWWPSELGGVQWWLGAVCGSAGEDFCEVSSEG